MDPLNDRYKDINTIYERNLDTWLWLWLPFYTLGSLIREVIAKHREKSPQEHE